MNSLRRACYLTFTTTILSSSYLLGQVAIGPLIGISYIPYKFNEFNEFVGSKGIDINFGVIAILPIQKKLNLESRLTFSKREETESTACDIVGCYNFYYTRSDLNFDFTFQYLLTEYISIGLGPSIIQTLNSNLIGLPDKIWQRFNGPEYNTNLNTLYYGLNTGLAFDLSRVRLSLGYMIRFKNNDSIEISNKSNSRLDLSISYLFGRK